MPSLTSGSMTSLAPHILPIPIQIPRWDRIEGCPLPRWRPCMVFLLKKSSSACSPNMRKTSNKPGFPGMKRVRQRTNSHCGPAVLEMLLSELKIFINQEKFVAAMNVEDKLKHHGMTVTELGDSVKRMVPTVNFWYRRGATVTTLNQLVNEYEVPAGVEWQGIFGKASDGDDGHYAVITRIHPETN